MFLVLLLILQNQFRCIHVYKCIYISIPSVFLDLAIYNLMELSKTLILRSVIFPFPVKYTPGPWHNPFSATDFLQYLEINVKLPHHKKPIPAKKANKLVNIMYSLSFLLQYKSFITYF